MSDWNAAAADYERQVTVGGAHANPPATLSEAMSSAYGAAGLSTFFGAQEPIEAAWQDLEKAIGEETGNDAATLTDQWGGRNSPPIDPEDRARLVVDSIGKLNKDQRDRILPLTDITAQAAQKAQATEDEAAAIAARTYGLGGNALAWAAGAAREVIDPVSLATALIPGGRAPFLTLKWAAEKFGIGAGISLALAPGIHAERAELGLPNASYFSEAVYGGLGNVALSGLFEGAARGAAHLMGLGLRPPMTPETFAALRDYAERNEVIADQAVPQTPAARQQLPEQINRAAARIETGEPPPREEPSLFPETRPVERAPIDRPALGPSDIIGPNGQPLKVQWKVVNLPDLVASHDVSGTRNPNYPQELQVRGREGAASRSWTAETAPNYDVRRAMPGPTMQEGPPIVSQGKVVVSGNGRKNLLELVYANHPDIAEAYRGELTARGFSSEGIDKPVLVGELVDPAADLAAIAREANVPQTAKLSPTEQAASDAVLLDAPLMALKAPGELTSLANIPFVTAFSGKIVAATERADFVTGDNRLSLAGARRIEAALIARGFGAPEVVAKLFEEGAVTSRAILGAFSDVAGLAARIQTEITAGRLLPADDPMPAMVEAFRLVEHVRSQPGARIEDALAQIDLEKGAVPADVFAAAKQFFRDDAKAPGGTNWRVAARRENIAAKLERTMLTTLEGINAVGDLLGTKRDAGFALREGNTAAKLVEELPIEPELSPAEAVAELATRAGAEGPGSLKDLIARGVSAEELLDHPDIMAGYAIAEAIPPTIPPQTMPPPEWWANRTYELNAADGPAPLATGGVVVGRQAATERLVEAAQSYAGPEGPLNERKATIILGPPAAGKSTIAEAIALKDRAAIPDPDDAKKIIPEFHGGIGAHAVHQESSILTVDVLAQLVRDGTNLVLPKVGADLPPQSLANLIAELKARGYEVNLVSLKVAHDEAARRMVGRFLSKRRLIGKAYFLGIGDKPSQAYYILKGAKDAEGRSLVDHATEVDGNGPQRKILDGADTPAADAIRGLGGHGELRSRSDGGAPGGREKSAAERQPAAAQEAQALDENAYAEQANANLGRTSRTAQGVVDVSSAKGKAEKMVEGLTGEGAAQAARSNFDQVIRELYRQRDSLPTDAEGMVARLDELAGRINAGIVKPGELDRTLETKFPGQTAPADLAIAKRQFAEELIARLNDRNADPVETAAWIEWRANLVDHFWSDGVGKTSKALAAVPLMRAGLPLPRYPDNKTFFSYGKNPRVNPREGGQAYLGEAWQRFNEFYHLLVGQKPEARPPAVAASVKPLGDPQLEADAQAIVDQVGEDFKVRLAEPGSELEREISIRDARQETIEDDAAADELLACMGLTSLPTEAANPP